ncbi:hypothetical protein KC207_00280 [Phycicoccus sp. BSK3Z-2]|uniref:Uncharacterized protein n=1 Tax=Phycicoccus avicenniae TaxID=2828860 RepID=A0A941D5C3_9MICO|nr:hypothetical protein [Phycicoccus avicenniae]MBR7741731.1 hypothetical protein [Phycicoccus avicenniae]
MSSRRRFRGRIAGVGSTSGVRVVVGWWLESPFGDFADVMVERPDGHRVLLAPSEQVADLVSSTYTFDEVRIEDVDIDGDRGRVDGDPRPGRWGPSSPSLTMSLEVGDRIPLGRLLQVLPRPLLETPAFATLADPVARVVVRGVRTRGVARRGRREYYGATDVHAVTTMAGTFDGVDLGSLAPVDPPCRFGFSSTPRRPSVTSVTTTIVDL